MAQYYSLGWKSAQNYVLEKSDKNIINSLNIYKQIIDADTPVSLLSNLADKLSPIKNVAFEVVHKGIVNNSIDERDEENVYFNFLYFFKQNNYYAG